MSFPIVELTPAQFTENGLELLHEIPQPPKALNYRGILPGTDKKLLAVVGSRNYTNYGKEVVEYLIGGLSGYDIGIVSGLAIGIDGLAHEAALRHNLYTLAIPGGGLAERALYPARHKRLAHQILDNNGALLSEYELEQRAAHWTFPQRNRLVTGMCHATLIIEAAEKSGTLITARMTVDYNRELLVVPGDIFSKNSAGAHQFLKLGATPVTSAEDILAVLGIEEVSETLQAKLATSLTLTEQKVLALLNEPLQHDVLIRKLNLPTNEAGVLLMQMELSGYIASSNNTYRSIL